LIDRGGSKRNRGFKTDLDHKREGRKRVINSMTSQEADLKKQSHRNQTKLYGAKILVLQGSGRKKKMRKKQKEDWKLFAVCGGERGGRLSERRVSTL